MSYDPRLPIPNSGITDPADKLYFLDSHFQRTWLRQTELFTDSHNRLAALETKRAYNIQGNTVGTPASTTATILHTYTLTANSGRVGRRIRVRASGVFAANGNTKTVAMSIGGLTVLTLSGAYNNLAWIIDADVVVMDTARQTVVASGIVNLQSPVAALTSATLDLTAPIIMKTTGTNGTAALNDIVAYTFSVNID